ncbi:conserved Plasmodium protein, unknown function [Plasmodium relictum]|uniref:Uncharacterized protein n=1 Tax=Plasmodium relictum TaxID=85471 RepID=A0A1J1H798_PLARL|nr:conserved Plasmodium protein, unknown function [Plasmodium relictum]CRH00421.1 conserved Plasmodium protein, unknown function [Plasmodium relictum]
MNNIPHIIVFAYNKENVKSFLKNLEDKFEFLEYYKNSDYFRIIFNNKNVSKENNYFIFRNEAKIRIVNKYYSADVIISSCIVKTKKKKDHEGKEENKELKQEQSDKEKEEEIDVKQILYECIIFLFDDFNVNEKTLINENPFRNYDNDCLEYIEDSLNCKMIKNEDFDFSNFYKEIGIKIAIFPLNFQKSNSEIMNFFSEYFIECLYINYKSEPFNKTDKQESSKNLIFEKLKENKRNKFEEYYEEDNERLIEALHCHMWKNLELKKKNAIIHNFVNNENKIKKDTKNDKYIKENKIDRCNENIKNDEIIKNKDNNNNNENIKDNENIKENENIKDSENIKDNEHIKVEHNVKDEKNIKNNKNNDETEVNKTDIFLQNFNQIVEKIKLAKNENKNCSDSVRRKKAEDLILELQQYFCDIDEE